MYIYIFNKSNFWSNLWFSQHPKRAYTIIYNQRHDNIEPIQSLTPKSKQVQVKRKKKLIGLKIKTLTRITKNWKPKKLIGLKNKTLTRITLIQNPIPKSHLCFCFEKISPACTSQIINNHHTQKQTQLGFSNSKHNWYTFLRSVALTVPSSETGSWYCLLVLPSTTVKEPLRLPGGRTTEVWAERRCGSRDGTTSVRSVEVTRWAVSTANRPLATTVDTSDTSDMFLKAMEKEDNETKPFLVFVLLEFLMRREQYNNNNKTVIHKD